MTRIKGWFMPDQLQIFIYDVVLSVVVLIFTYILIKLLYRFSNRVLREGAEGGNEQADKGVISDKAIRSVRILLQTIILYGCYFIAAIVILQIFNLKIISPDDLKAMGARVLKIIGILVGAKLVINFGQLVVKQAFDKHETTGRRAQTLEILLHSAITYLVFFMACLMVLQIFNVNTSAILASAGILGLAVGFGAQNLVKDIISGFFILFEDQFSVGDFVQIDEVTGTVEEVGLRTCKIRQWTGQLSIIPNGGITRVTNYNRGPMLAQVTVGIAYEEDIDQAIKVLKEACEAAFQEVEAIIELPQVQGVTELAHLSVNICAVAPTLPGEHWAVERELRKRFKYALDRAGIEIPYPKQVIYQNQE
ncbi:MAG: mechanosensitive ion channel family protein [Desulfotomaculaceae bacterium]|nr:mechanosensitive ion channel family protein [Desulfotomaculaceae bacterium]